MAVDPLERRTWAGIRIQVGHRTATQLWDRNAEIERQTIYVPAYPIANWIVSNWWSLLYEPEKPVLVSESSQDDAIGWRQRHELRMASSDLMLPDLQMFSDGQGVEVRWHEDGENEYPHLPGVFATSGDEHFSVDEVRIGLQDFVSRVVARLNGADRRSAQLKQDWSAIVEADQEEIAFCRAAGTLGLDPYQLDDWPAELANLLESGFIESQETEFVADFLQAADAESAVGTWSWIESARRELGLGASPHNLTPPAGAVDSRPWKVGYSRAGAVREALHLDRMSRIDDVREITRHFDLEAMVAAERNHLPTPRINGIVGWQSTKRPVFAGRAATHEQSRRFLHARALYHALYGCGEGPRLETEANTWPQRASRAFAAELLAPQEALVAAVESQPSESVTNVILPDLAYRFGVSDWVIRHQLTNAGILPFNV